MTIYIDIIIVENLIMNYIILYATGLISKSKKSYLRMFMASLIGAIYATLEYVLKVMVELTDSDYYQKQLKELEDLKNEKK